MDQLKHEINTKAFLAKNARELFRNKTELGELPILFRMDSSSVKNPEVKSSWKTSDLTLWVKFLDEWFRPYGSFNQKQIMDMVELCYNDMQVISLMELLSASNKEN